VLGTAAGGLEEAVTSGENGLLVPPDDAGALAEALERWLADPVGLERMGEQARRTVRDRFDASRNFERLFELLGGEAPVAVAEERTA
jgi:glycosyltransferase involved in cell wall biosynthesis